MPANPTSLPLDLTANALSNRVTAESHTVGSVEGSTFALDYGSFYTESLVIRMAATGTWLQPGNDFKALHLHKAASKASNREVCQVIHVEDHVTGELLISAQMVGGEYSGNAATIQELIDAQNLDGRDAVWGEILHKPEQFNPASHLHHLNQLYGWEGAINLLEQIRIALLRGDVAVREAMYNYLNSQLDDKQSQIDALQSALQNYQLATTAERGMALLAGLNTPLSNNEKTVHPAYLKNTIDKQYQNRPIARAAVYGHSPNLKKWTLTSSVGDPGEAVAGTGHYRLMGDNGASGIYFIIDPGAEGLTQYELDRPALPEVGNWLQLDRVQGSGRSFTEGYVHDAFWGGYFGRSVYYVHLRVVDVQLGNYKTGAGDLELYFPRELREQYYLQRGNILVTKPFEGVVNIIRISEGYYYINLKRDALEKVPAESRVFPASFFDETDDLYPRVITGADTNLDVLYSDPGFYDEAAAMYMRNYVPIAVREVHEEANETWTDTMFIQLWAY